MEIPRTGGLSPGELLGRVYRQFEEDDVLTYAGSLAFHALLALFPLLIFLLALITFLDLPQIMERLLEWGGTVLPRSSMREILGVLEGAQENRSVGLLSLSVLGAIWAASGGVRSAMNVLNQAYDVAEQRAAWKRYLLSLLYTLGLAVLVVTATGLMLVGQSAAGWLARQLGTDRVVVDVWTWVRYPLAIALLMVSTAIAYSVLPNLQRFRWLTPGAVLAVLLWIGLSLLFQLYLDNFGSYDVLYGSVGAIIVLLLYLWLSSIIFLLGGEVNAVIDRARGEAGGSPDRRPPPARS